MRKQFLKKFISSVLIATLAVSSINFTKNPTEVKAVETDASDDTVIGTGISGAAKGNWCTDYNEATIYRVYPILLKKSLDSVKKDSTVKLNYEDQYYTFRDIALYTTSTKEAKNAYYFTSKSTSGKKTISHLTLDDSGKFDFSDLGVKLNLPTHTIGINGQKYISFSDELNKKIITEGKKENLKKIFSNYIDELDDREKNLTSKGKKELSTLKSISGYDTDNFESYLNHFGFVIELCSTATNMKSGKKYVFSYGDLLTTKVGEDAYSVYCLYTSADKDLLTWDAEYKARKIKIKPESALGEATYFFCNASKEEPETRTQAMNVVISYNGDMKANTNTTALSKSWRGTTSEKNPEGTSLGHKDYKAVVSNAYNNSLKNKQIYLSDDETLIDTSSKADTITKLSNTGDTSGYTMLGYDALQIPISSKSYKLKSLRQADIAGALSNVSIKTNASAVYGGFGNTYTYSFQSGADTVKGSVATALSNVNGVTSVYDVGSVFARGNTTTLANLQGGTFLAGKITGTKNMKKSEGTIYASISYLAKDKNVTSKKSEVYINEKAEVAQHSNISSANYRADETKTWNIGRKDATYVLAWKTNEYNMTDSKKLTEDMIRSLGQTYILRGEQGATTLSNAFRNVTGKSVIGAKYIKKENNVTVGSASMSDNNISGVSVLVVKVSYALPVKVYSEDSLASNELNYIYPNLLGEKSNVSSIIPIGNYVLDMTYPYSVTHNLAGDLNNKYGVSLTNYYEPTGLFGPAKYTTKNFNATAYPSYAYTLTRAIWGDTPVITSYRSNELRSDVLAGLNSMGYILGNIGKTSPIVTPINTESVFNQTKADDYKFRADINAGGVLVNQNNEYNIIHRIKKYTALDKGTAENREAGRGAYLKSNDNVEKNIFTFVNTSSSKISVFPEVGFSFNLPLVSNDKLTGVSNHTVYTMGEKIRTALPSSIRGISMTYKLPGNNVSKGDINTTSGLTGSTANADANGNIVIAQGSDIQCNASNDVRYKLVSYSLDINDNYNGENLKKVFNADNLNYKPEEEHEAYVEAFKNNVKVEATMKVGTKSYTDFNIANPSKKSEDTETKTIKIKFAHGKITDNTKADVIRDMSNQYHISLIEAEEMFNKSGIENQLNEMFESSIDSDNHSSNKWYDEESVAFVIKRYSTVVNLGDIIISDKLDYGTYTSNGSVNGAFYLTVSVPETFYGAVLGNERILIREQKVAGSDFTVNSQHTIDMNKGQ